MPRALTDDEKRNRAMYAGRLRTPGQIESAREYQRLWARANPGKKHTWRKKNPDKARESARLSMKRLREADPAAYRASQRRRAGLPEPTRPEPERCEICGDANSNGKALHLDHDHRTGAFRGWLCDLHNRGLGYFKDSPEMLRKAAGYLEGRLEK